LKETDFEKLNRFQKELPLLEEDLKIAIPKSYSSYYAGLGWDRKEDEKYNVRSLRNQIRWRHQEIQRILKENLWKIKNEDNQR